MKDMFVWRKSIYENNFKCNQCGAKLFNPKTGQPTDNLVVDADDANIQDPKDPIFCYCGKCQNAVATWQPVDAEDVDNDNILQGSYSEWVDKKAQDLNEEMKKRLEDRISKKYEQKIKDLENQIKSKDAQIKKLKLSYETAQLEKDKKIRDLSKELEHAEKQIDRLEDMIEQQLIKEE